VGRLPSPTNRGAAKHRRIYEAIETVASGTRTKAEISGYVQAMDIYVTGPVI
jgi:hypothetical protein